MFPTLPPTQCRRGFAARQRYLILIDTTLTVVLESRLLRRSPAWPWPIPKLLLSSKRDKAAMLHRKTQSSISVILRARSRVARQRAALSATRNGKTNGLADALIRRCLPCTVTAQFRAVASVCGNNARLFLALASRDALYPRVGASIAVLTERCADRG